MNIKLQKNEKLIIFTTIILMILLFLGIYFLVLFPKMEKVPLKEKELSQQEQILAALQSKVTGTNSSTFQSTVSLQKMVPVKPLSQQLLLDIEKAEVVSGSFVVKMTFADGEVTAEEQSAENEAELTEDQKEQLGMSEEEEEERPIIPLPTGVKKMTVTLNVESPSYFEFEEFISILENSERITVIETIDFTANEEIIDQEQINEPLSYQVRLSAFYMPTLSDLIDNLPKMETPEPAEKKNPFSNFGEYSTSTNAKKSTDTEDEQKSSTPEVNETTKENVDEKSTKTSKMVEYTVQAGDHLTKIAKQYFATDYKAGILLIKEANDMKNDDIRTGQILKIPNQ